MKSVEVGGPQAKTWIGIKRLRPLLALLGVVAGLLAISTPVSAGGNSSTPCSLGPQPATCTYTVNMHGLIQTFQTNVPCVDPQNGPPTGVLTTTYSEVFHETVNQAGDAWLTSTVTGDLSFIPYDSSRPSYTGHFESWFGESFNLNNMVPLHDTNNTTLTGSDGSHLSIHMIDHMSISASGITLQFDKASC
jgi:hypothetical protein